MSELKQIRCSNCNKVLMEADLVEGTIRKKCKCGVYTTIEKKPTDPRPSIPQRTAIYSVLVSKIR